MLGDPMRGAAVRIFIQLTLGVLILLLAYPLTMRAQEPSGVGERQTEKSPMPNSAAPPSQLSSARPRGRSVTVGPLKATLADFAWLEGRWQGAWGPRVVEQMWMPPRAGQMLGLFRVVGNNRTLVIELFSLRETPDGIEFLLRHFTPSLIPWEESGAATLKLTSFDPSTAVFENPAGGAPKRNSFTRIGPDTFSSRSEVIPNKGNEQVTEIVYHRQKAGVGH
jgi:Domain of unknown function (DUF6265)